MIIMKNAKKRRGQYSSATSSYTKLTRSHAELKQSLHRNKTTPNSLRGFMILDNCCSFTAPLQIRKI